MPNVGIGPVATNFSEILIKINTFSFNKMHLIMSSGKSRPYCLDFNVLIKLIVHTELQPNDRWKQHTFLIDQVTWLQSMFNLYDMSWVNSNFCTGCVESSSVTSCAYGASGGSKWLREISSINEEYGQTNHVNPQNKSITRTEQTKKMAMLWDVPFILHHPYRLWNILIV